MNAKRRVRAALAHQESDRVPLDYYARDEVTASLRQRLNLGPEESLEERLGVDLRPVGPRFTPPAADLSYADPSVRVDESDLHYDIWGVGFRPNSTASGFYMDLASSPLTGLESPEELDNYPWPSADQWDYSQIAAQAKSQAKYWVWAHSRGIFEISWFVRGFDEFLLDLAAAPERANALMDKVQRYLMERTRRILEAGDGWIDMVEYNDDVAGQNGMLISPRMWRQFLKPRMSAFIEMCKGYGVAIRYHCCGGLRPILPDLIEIGVDVITPVQTVAAGMEPERLKRDFGDRLVFNGGIDTQGLLPRASAAEVAAETARLMEVLGKKGGLILGPAHVFQADVPVENVLAVYATALGHPV